VNKGQLTTNFHIREFKCNDGSKVPEALEANVRLLAEQLQALRDFIGIPIHLNSAYRTEAYNASIGGSPKSQHKLAKAADLVTSKYTPAELADIIKKLIKEGKMMQGGVGVYPSFCHYDCRNVEARW
jgi:uncharacterized protein YcbK (DUF882 family)